MAGPSTSRPEAGLLGGRYDLREPIGTGGMASVWLAEDTRLQRDVAVKLLSESLAADPAFVARFRREAHVAASLRQANLVGVFDYEPDADRPYLVMEYVPGPNLGERLAGGEQISVERLAGDLLSALAAIHRAGVVHRDVKPQNVLLAPGGRAMLTDFGIARPQDATSITQTGQMPGTARYMAPELMQGEAATPASDLYSCGIVLGECLEEGSSHPSVRHLVERLCREDPHDRPASADTAMAELLRPRRALEPQTAPTQANRTQAQTPPPAPPAARPPAHPPLGHGRTIHVDRSRLIAVAALGAIALVVVLLIALSGGDETPSAGNDARAQSQAAGNANSGENSGEGGAGSQSQDSSGPGSGVPEPSDAPDAAEGAALDQQGRALIDAGDPEAAVPVLQQAVASFPQGTDDINYAFALFNLGQALRLAGRPEEAIPVLRRRLEIPNQTGIVRQELNAAIAEAE